MARPCRGGVYGEGSVFETDPTTGNTTLLHSFFGDDGNDGEAPEGALIDYKEALYGTTVNGGGLGYGAVFYLDPKTKAESMLVYFDDDNTGGFPMSRLVERSGVLYGTCGEYPGTIFVIDAITNSFKIIYRFSDHGVASPVAGLTADGNTLYGASVYGSGSVYGFNISKAKLKQIHAFGKSHRDGRFPVSDLILVNGTLYGTASAGGKSGQGIVFGINIATKAETILHEFTGGGDGGDPVAGLVFYNGALYGTTYSGALGYGTVFEVKP